jgi:hypothetical protein|tara:strand:- start:240 stop:446 length:207 start_codon:yes stop_codon:yes gene_type:complete
MTEFVLLHLHNTSLFAILGMVYIDHKYVELSGELSPHQSYQAAKSRTPELTVVFRAFKAYDAYRLIDI